MRLLLSGDPLPHDVSIAPIDRQHHVAMHVPHWKRSPILMLLLVGYPDRNSAKEKQPIPPHHRARRAQARELRLPLDVRP